MRQKGEKEREKKMRLVLYLANWRVECDDEWQSEVMLSPTETNKTAKLFLGINFERKKETSKFIPSKTNE